MQSKSSAYLPAGTWEKQPFPRKLNQEFSLSLNGTKLIYPHRGLSQENPQPCIPNRKTHLQLHKTCYGMLKGGTKDKKREDNRDGWLVSRLLVICLPSSVLHLSTACPVFPWNSISNSPRVKRLSPLCAQAFGVSVAGAGDYSSCRPCTCGVRDWGDWA